MMRIEHLAAITVLAALSWSPVAWGQTMLELAGSSYRGTVTVEAVAGYDDPIQHHAIGEAEITLELNRERQIELNGRAIIDGQEAMQFDYVLSEQADWSWRDGRDDNTLEISQDGEISMLARSDGFTIVAGGVIDASRFSMHLRTSGHATAPDLVFDFDLVSRDDARPEMTDRCSQMVWQPRALANPCGCSMSTVMVPVCLATQ